MCRGLPRWSRCESRRQWQGWERKGNCQLPSEPCSKPQPVCVFRGGLLLTQKFQRSTFARIYEHGNELHILSNDGTLRSFAGDAASLLGAILDALRRPRTADQLVAQIVEATGTTEGADAVVEALALLQCAGVIHELSTSARKVESAEMPRKRVVLALAGGIAAAYAPALVELLSSRGYSVRVAATKSALKFVRGLALEALTHERVVRSLWPTNPRKPVPHLALSQWADIVVVYPATATTLSRIARGDCSTAVSALAISARTPVLLVPAMNSTMYDAPTIQRNLKQLREDGFWIAHPARGYEAARAPAHRKPTFGAALPVQLLVGIIDAILSSATRHSSSKASKTRSMTKNTR